MSKLDLTPVVEIDAGHISSAVAQNRPFVVRGWVSGSHGWRLDDERWARHTGDVTVFPSDDTTVSSASYVLRRKGMTHEMSFRELFGRIEGDRRWHPLIEQNERYYMFGGQVPAEFLQALPWPEDLAFEGASPYVASAGVTAKAHYDHWYVFLVQLHGAKEVKLFPPSDYGFIYPHYRQSADKPRRAMVDLNDPDFDRFPMLRKLRGQIVKLDAGDLLYMPIDWWHEVQTGAFSVSVNRRLRRSAEDWRNALLAFSSHLLRAAHRYGVEPLATDEVKGLGKQAYFEWAREHGSTDRARWYAFLAQPGPDQAQATRIPDSLGCLVARWLQSGQEPTRAQIEALDP